MEIKNVLVPTDFSLPSKAAVNYGVALARKFRAKLTLLHVLDPHPLLEETADIDRETEQTLRGKAFEELLNLVSPEDEDDLDLQIVVKFGDIHKEISNTIKERGTDLIVLGTHGRGRVGRLILGSTTERLLRKLAIPVLSVRTTAPMNFTQILFATDLSESSVQGFDFAVDLARKFGSKIVAVHVLDKRMVSILDDAVIESRERTIQDAKRKLGLLFTEGKRSGVDVETQLVEGTAAPLILKAAEEYRADLILLAISGKSHAERVMFGATADRIVREGDIPVLSVPVRVNAEPELTRSRR